MKMSGEWSSTSATAKGSPTLRARLHQVRRRVRRRRCDVRPETPISAMGARLRPLDLGPTAERIPLAADVPEPGELPVCLDDQPVHVAELAEQQDPRAVVADRHGDEAVVGVVARHVGHVDAADRLGVQRHHKGHRLSAVVWRWIGSGMASTSLGSVSSPGPFQRRPGHLLAARRSTDAIRRSMARRDPRGLQGIGISRRLNLAAADLTFQQVQPDRHDQNCDPVQRHDGCERRRLARGHHVLGSNARADTLPVQLVGRERMDPDSSGGTPAAGGDT
jgi:hypothetical protein